MGRDYLKFTSDKGIANWREEKKSSASSGRVAPVVTAEGAGGAVPAMIAPVVASGRRGVFEPPEPDDSEDLTIHDDPKIDGTEFFEIASRRGRANECANMAAGVLLGIVQGMRTLGTQFLCDPYEAGEKSTTDISLLELSPVYSQLVSEDYRGSAHELGGSLPTIKKAIVASLMPNLDMEDCEDVMEEERAAWKEAFTLPIPVPYKPYAVEDKAQKGSTPVAAEGSEIDWEARRTATLVTKKKGKCF